MCDLDMTDHFGEILSILCLYFSKFSHCLCFSPWQNVIFFNFNQETNVSSAKEGEVVFGLKGPTNMQGATLGGATK